MSSVGRLSTAVDAPEAQRGTNFRSVIDELFPRSHVLLPQINQIYELELAYGEYVCLEAPELVKRGAYFRSIHDEETYHLRICLNTPNQVNASALKTRKDFFAANLFAVGYATHGLFPYRGKFHPQMIKAVMNVMGLKPGETVLDPMAGCGTTSIEASIMGINSIAVELSPFACLMTRAKVEALDTDRSSFPRLLENADDLFQTLALPDDRPVYQPDLFAGAEGRITSNSLTGGLPAPMLELLLLCYLDAVGYAARRKNKKPHDLFPDLLGRYLAAVEAINESREAMGLTLGRADVVCGDARHLELTGDSVDGILFSPPYSFAIDYVENDRPQLERLGVNVDELKRGMVGLNGSGRSKEELIQSRLHQYFADMEAVMQSCARVLKPGRYCVVVIGSNTNQTGGVSLEQGLIDIGAKAGMPLEFQITREIEGIRNTMRDEFLLFFRKSNAADNSVL
jgi:SAM-dependent methyltransferase